MLVACKMDSKHQSQNNFIPTSKDSLVVNLQDNEQVLDTSRLNSISFSTIIKKVEKDVDLKNEEYVMLVDSLSNGYDESMSEQYGYFIFNYLQDKETRSESILEILNFKTKPE